MERNIKFRGLRSDGKGKIYGDLVKPREYLRGVYICPVITSCDFAPGFDEDTQMSLEQFQIENPEISIGGFLEVIPESVGQFTGLKDNSGKELYEGDIISDMEDEPMVLPVIWDNEYAQFAVDISYDKDGGSIEDIPTCFEDGFVIIGNVFENPELLKLNSYGTF